MNAKRMDLADRIKRLVDSISKGTECLERGDHATWSGFRPAFAQKLKGGKPAPPHRDWVKSVVLPRAERALRHAERVLDRVD